MRKLKLMAATSAVALLTAGSAYAADPVEREGMSLVVYGLVNHMVLYADGDSNGHSSDHLTMPVQHGIPTRFGFKASGNINDTLQLGAKIEVSLSESRAGSVNPNDHGAGDADGFLELRQAYWWVKSATAGSFRVGHSDVASNGISEIDLSGTAVPTLGSTVWYDGAGFYSGNKMQTIDGGDGGRSSVGREDLIRYDSPSIGGFKIAASLTDTNDASIALRYARAFGDIKIAAGIGHDDYGGFRAAGESANSLTTGSASIKHSSGLSLTGSYGEFDRDAGDRSSFMVKVGYSASLNEYGATHFAVDYGETDYESSAGGVDPESFGVTIVQDISHLGSKFYAMYRNFDSTTDADIFLVGALVKF